MTLSQVLAILTVAILTLAILTLALDLAMDLALVTRARALALATLATLATLPNLVLATCLSRHPKLQH